MWRIKGAGFGHKKCYDIQIWHQLCYYCTLLQMRRLWNWRRSIGSQPPSRFPCRNKCIPYLSLIFTSLKTTYVFLILLRYNSQRRVLQMVAYVGWYTLLSTMYPIGLRIQIYPILVHPSWWIRCPQDKESVSIVSNIWPQVTTNASWSP